MIFKSTRLTVFFSVSCVFFIMSFMPVVLADGVKKSSLLKHAILKRKAGDYNQAIGILNQLRAQHVEHKRINIELVLNYIKLQQYTNAEQIVQHLQVLSLTEREQEKVEKLKRLLEIHMRKSLSAHTYTVDLGFSLGVDIANSRFPVFSYDQYQGYDEYIHEDDIIDETSEAYETTDYSDTGEYWNREDITEESEVSYTRQFLRINYRYRPAQQFELFSYATQWIIDNEVNIDYRHLNQSANNNYLNYEWNTSLYLLQINRWLLELNALASAHDNDNNRVLNKYSGRLALTIPFQQFKIKFAVDQQRKSYHERLSHFDANINTPWAEISYQVSPQFRVASGIRLRTLTARDEINSYTNRDAFLTISYYPTVSLSAYLSYHRNNLHYKIDNPDVVAWSKEVKNSLAFGGKYQMNKQLSFGLSGTVGNKKIEQGFGEDDWRRVEGRVTYRF